VGGLHGQLKVADVVGAPRHYQNNLILYASSPLNLATCFSIIPGVASKANAVSPSPCLSLLGRGRPGQVKSSSGRLGLGFSSSISRHQIDHHAILSWNFSIPAANWDLAHNIHSENKARKRSIALLNDNNNTHRFIRSEGRKVKRVPLK
jgi:hypothetical protein